MNKLKIELLLFISIKIGSILHISSIAEIYVIIPRSAENGCLKGGTCLSVCLSINTHVLSSKYV
jgi:hypothetical protein